MVLELKLRAHTAFTNTVLEQGDRTVDFPTVRNILRIEVTSITPAGDALVSSVIEGGSTLDDVVDVSLRQRVEADLAKTRGRRASWRMTPTGSVADLALDAPELPAAARQRLLELLDAMPSVVFPDADIGIGASWQTRSEVSISHVRWQRTVTYRLKALTDSTATVEGVLEGRADSQALSTEPNATMRLTSATARATSELVVPLHQLVGTGRSQGTSETNLQIVRGHLRITSTAQTDTITSMKPLAE